MPLNIPSERGHLEHMAPAWLASAAAATVAGALCHASQTFAAPMTPSLTLSVPRMLRSRAEFHAGSLRSAFGTPGVNKEENQAHGITACGLVSSAVITAAVMARRRRTNCHQRGHMVPRGPFRRDLSLDGYPIHGPGYYWTLSKDTAAVLIYVPVADDVNAKDVVFDCHDWTLKLGFSEDKGGLIINDKVLYKVDVEESYFVMDEGQYGERCLVVWLYKLTREQDWYAYDRFEPVSERFLLEGEKERANLEFKITHKTFLDIEMDGTEMGRVVLGLYGDIAPRTVENFRCLCTGEKGNSEETGEPLHYKGTCFHRVISGFCIQGGQTWENDEGSGGESIYGLTFDDENLRVKFRKPGILAMANGGPDTNGSQFFITTIRADHLNHKNVAFGEVMEGMEVIRAIESVGGEADEDGLPRQLAIVSDCGEIALEPGQPVIAADDEDESGKPTESSLKELLVGSSR